MTDTRHPRPHRLFRLLAASGLTLTLVALAGCGGGAQTSLSGKVQADGKPVTSGRLEFAPIKGGDAAPASTEIGSDGTYKITAPVGKARVTFNPPSPQYPKDYTPKPSEPPPPAPYQGYAVKQPEVEIKSGGTLDIEISKGGK